jgi:Na+/melibiose symporter-like transporter
MVFRKILAVLTGIVLGMLVIGLIEALGHRLFPVPQEVNQTYENQDTETLLALISPKMLLFVLLAYISGSFVAGLFTAWIGRSKELSLITGLVLMLGGAITVFMIPHPVWFILVSLSVYIPFSWLGGWLILKFFPETPENL